MNAFAFLAPHMLALSLRLCQYKAKLYSRPYRVKHVVMLVVPARAELVANLPRPLLQFAVHFVPP